MGMVESSRQNRASLEPMGLDTSVVSELAQAFARILVDRGYNEEEIRERLVAWAKRTSESDFWTESVSEIADDLAGLLDLPSYPDDEGDSHVFIESIVTPNICAVCGAWQGDSEHYDE